MSEEQTPEEPLEFEMDLNGPIEYISAAFYALSAMEDIDIEIIPDAQKNRIKRIRAKSIRMIDHCINELYADLFDDDNKE
jgi:hypothetical protein